MKYTWNKKELKKIINYIKTIDSEHEEINTTINILNNIKKSYKLKDNKKENKNQENDEYNYLKTYNPIIDEIIKNNNDIFNYDTNYIEFKKIYSSKKDILLFTYDMLKTINENWYKILYPIIKDKNIINFKKNSNNYIYYLKYIDKFYISLSKSNNIEDFFAPIHEYLHIYSTLKNEKFFNKIESEFLSILGELITAYEMKKKNMFCKEIIKFEVELYNTIYSYINNYKQRKLIIENKIDNKKKTKYILKTTDLTKEDINNMYYLDLTNTYSYIIAYFLAINLLTIYLNDKEKCLYLINQFIVDNDNIIDKLSKYNINISTNKTYIKELKKEYEYYK